MADLLMEYEAYLKNRGNSPNTISFYMRILKAVYNRAFGVMERPDFRQTDRTCLYRSVSTISTTADTLSTRPIMRVSRVTPRMLIA